MLSIQVELATLHPNRWALEFRNEKYAELELEERSELLAKLIAATDLAIDSAILNDPEDEWARISRADLMLLASNNPDKVELNYEKCTAINAFSASSLRRQLKIYQDLALFQENVEAALNAIADDPAPNGKPECSSAGLNEGDRGESQASISVSPNGNQSQPAEHLS